MACTSCTEKETYFQLVKYPVQAAAQMNNKLLTAQLARHGKADWADSDRAYDSIVSLTKPITQQMEPYDGFPTTQTSGFQPGGKKSTIVRAA